MFARGLWCTLGALVFLGCNTTSTRPPDARVDAGVDTATAGTFGVFAAFTDEFLDFRKAMGLDTAAYQAWAGDRMRELGARWTRSNLQLIWDLVEPTVGGARDWRASVGGETVFAAATSRKVQYLAAFHPGGGPTAPAGGKPQMRNPLDDVPAWQSFVQATVERFDGDGVDDAPGGIVIKYWQLGNEVQDWTDTGRDASQYADFVAVTAEAARKADPDARIVLIAETNATHLGPFYKTVLQALAAKQVKFDAVDIHDYGPLTASRVTTVPEMRAALDAAGYSDAEIWSAEHASYVGAPAVNLGTSCTPACASSHVCHPAGLCVPKCASNADCPAMSDWVCDTKTGLCALDMPAQTEREQARSLVYRFAINRQAGVRRIMWATLASWRCFAGDCSGLFDRVGLVSGGFLPEETAADLGKKRLAYHSFRLLSERTDDPTAEPDGEVTMGDADVHVFRYRQRQSGRKGLLAWSDAAKTVTLAFDGASARLTSLVTAVDGSPLRSEAVSVSSGKVSVALDPDPVWISETATW